MELNLKNEEVVYIYEHFNDYKEGIENRESKKLALAKGQMELYKSIYGDSEDFDNELYELHERLFSELMPAASNKKIEFLKGILDSFEPIYSVIAESSPEFIEEVRENFMDKSQECLEVLNQIKDKINGKDQF